MDEAASKGLKPALQMLAKESEEMPAWAIAILSLLGRGKDVNNQSVLKEIDTWVDYCRLGQVDYVGEPYDHLEIEPTSVPLPDEHKPRRKVYAGDVLINTKSALLLVRLHYGDRPETELKRLKEQMRTPLETVFNDDPGNQASTVKAEALGNGGEPEALSDDRECRQTGTEQAIVKIKTSKPRQNGGQGKSRNSQLFVFIWRVHQFLNKTKKPTAQEVWAEIQHRHKNHDTDKIIQEVDGERILWCSGYNNEQRQSRRTFDKTLSNIRKAPPF